MCVYSFSKCLVSPTPQSSTVSEPYSQYCANLVEAKLTLETKRQQPAFEDFLQRCLDSDFSRKIDLWTFLGIVRTASDEGVSF